jgi:hypothetical protein
MPTPRKGEAKKDFVSRYMGHPESKKSFPDPQQRMAVAYSVFGEKKKRLTPVINMAGEINFKGCS